MPLNTTGAEAALINEDAKQTIEQTPFRSEEPTVEPVVPPSPFTQPQSDDVLRRYMMLEQLSVNDMIVQAIEDLGLDRSGEPPLDGVELAEKLGAHFSDVKVFIPLGVREARNADHAYRQLVRERLGDAHGAFDLVAVAEKMWRPGTHGQAPSGGMKYTVTRR